MKLNRVFFLPDPPLSFFVTAGVTLSNTTLFVPQQKILVSSPYDPSTIQDLILRIGNTTDVIAAVPINARYVTLTIEGSFLGDGKGGTVAEMAVL